MSFTVIIPARYGSTRLPGKPLLLIGGKPIITHVCERSLASGAETVIVATDDDRIARVVKALPVQVCMTSPYHNSGTERLAEVIKTLQFPDSEIIVNVQGDEPLISPRNIQQVASNLQGHSEASIATLCVTILQEEELKNTNVVKVVMNEKGHALYFSRAPIPWARQPTGHYRHVGVYAYRVGFLKQYVQWKPSPLEQLESLEQLRALWYGHIIQVEMAAEKHEAGIDTESDLKRLQAVINKQF